MKKHLLFVLFFAIGFFAIGQTYKHSTEVKLEIVNLGVVSPTAQILIRDISDGNKIKQIPLSGVIQGLGDLKSDGTIPMAASFNMNNNNLTNVNDILPIDDNSRFGDGGNPWLVGNFIRFSLEKQGGGAFWNFVNISGDHLAVGTTATFLGASNDLYIFNNSGTPANPNDILTKAFGDANYLGGGTSLQSSWKFSTITITADPGAKNMRFNNSTPASVTEIYLSSTTNNGAVIDNILGIFKTGDILYFQQRNTGDKFLLGTISGTPTDNTGWWTIPVTVDDSGTLIDDNAEAAVIWAQSDAAAGNFVDLTTAQTVSGVKTWVNQQNFETSLLLDERTDTRPTPIGWEQTTLDFFPVLDNNRDFLWMRDGNLNWKHKTQAANAGAAFVQTNTAVRQYTLKDANGIVAFTSDVLAGADQTITAIPRIINTSSAGELSFRQEGTEIARLGGNNDDALYLNAFEALPGGVGYTASESPLRVPDDPFAVGWDGNLETLTKNAFFDEVEKKAEKIITDEEITATTYTPVATDLFKIKEMNNAARIVISTPTGSYSDGDNFSFQQTGVGVIEFNFPDWISGSTLRTTGIGDALLLRFSTAAKNGSNWKFLGASESYIIPVYQGDNAADPINEINGTNGTSFDGSFPGFWASVSSSPSPQDGAVSLVYEHNNGVNANTIGFIELTGVKNGDDITVVVYLQEIVGTNWQAGLRIADGFVADDFPSISSIGSYTEHTFNGVATQDDPLMRVVGTTSSDAGDQFGFDDIVITINP